jgi:hypothetical protein
MREPFAIDDVVAHPALSLLGDEASVLLVEAARGTCITPVDTAT